MKQPKTPVKGFLFIVGSVAAASSISTLGGVGLELTAEKLFAIIPLVVALPALNTLVGDYATVIAAHAAEPGENESTRKSLLRSILISALISVFGVVMLSSIIAVRRGYHLTPLLLSKFGLFVLTAVILVVLFMFVFTRILDKIFEKRKLNSDDVLIPIVTTVTDVLMLGMISLSTLILF